MVRAEKLSQMPRFDAVAGWITTSNQGLERGIPADTKEYDSHGT